MVAYFIATPQGFRHSAALYQCALGRGGLKPAIDKREGDGASPIGLFPMRRVFYRADRLAAPYTALSCQALDPQMGWCDDPAHTDYNRLIRLPHSARHEKLWRDDHVYDLIVELGHNDSPPIAGLGSAIFLHLAHPDYSATQGCVALALPHLLAVLHDSAPGSMLEIRAALDPRPS